MPQTLPANERGMLDCLRVDFDQKRKEDHLLRFGRDSLKSDIVLRETCYSRHQAELYIHPTSRELTIRDFSSGKSTDLLFRDSCGPLGTWSAADDTLIEQTILPSSDAVLAFHRAHFAFLWYAPSMEKEIRVAKEAFVHREITKDIRRTPPPRKERWDGKRPHTEYPEQHNYRPDISPLMLLRLPPDIRYLIFQLVVLHADLIDPDTSFGVAGHLARVEGHRLQTVHGCINLLNRSHQLLNPLHSSRELAIEAAGVFYAQNVFQVNTLNFSSFICTLKHMPSLEPFDPLSALSRLRLFLNCEGSTIMGADIMSHLGNYQQRAHGWSHTELLKDLTAITTQFPALRYVEVCIQSKALCWDPSDLFSPKDLPMHVLKTITLAIKAWMDHGGRNVRVFLQWLRWTYDNGIRVGSEVTMENITACWHDHTCQEEDEKMLCKENLDWVRGFAWHHPLVEEDWERKMAIQAAQMRLKIVKWLRKEQDGALLSEHNPERNTGDTDIPGETGRTA